MKKSYQHIWNLSKPYQDKRKDKGHAKTVVKFATELLKKVKANPDIVIPAIILHDIGWAAMPKSKLLRIFRKDCTKREKYLIQRLHERRGVQMARKILHKVRYKESLIPKILRIVRRHDTGVGARTIEEMVVRDADKLWRFTSYHHVASKKRSDISFKDRIQRLKKSFIAPVSDISNHIFTKEAKRKARFLLKELVNTYAGEHEHLPKRLEGRKYYKKRL